MKRMNRARKNVALSIVTLGTVLATGTTAFAAEPVASVDVSDGSSEPTATTCIPVPPRAITSQNVAFSCSLLTGSARSPSRGLGNCEQRGPSTPGRYTLVTWALPTPDRRPTADVTHSPSSAVPILSQSRE